MFTKIILESVGWLVLCWLPTQFALIAIWSWRRSDRARRMVWTGLAALPVLLAISLLVQTPREQIVKVCRDLATSVEKADIAAIEVHFADELEVRGYDRDALVTRLRRRLEEIRISDVLLGGFDVTMASRDTAVVTFRATGRVRGPDLLQQWISSRWKLTLRRSGDSWLITGIESLPVTSLEGGRLWDRL